MADPLADLPPDLAALITRLSSLIGVATEELAANLSTSNVAQWQSAIEELLMRYHTAAFITGHGGKSLPSGAKELIIAQVGKQIEYLDEFAKVIVASGEVSVSRAKSYATSTKASYWEAKAYGLPVPSVPGDGTTQCLGNCKCSLRIEWKDRKNKDADIFWVLHPAEHCQSCTERASQWNPLEVRGGVLQL